MSLERKRMRWIVVAVSAYVTAQLISNICSLQIVSVFGLAMDAGTFIYPLSFTLRDVCQMLLGKRETKTLIWSAACATLFMSLVFWLISMMPMDASGGSAEWSRILTPVWRLTLASITAGLVSELIDTEIYSWWTEKITLNHPWSRVLVSNAFSIPVDSLIFSFGAFGGNLPTAAVWQIFIGNLWIKAVVTLLSIPMIYMVKDKENE